MLTESAKPNYIRTRENLHQQLKGKEVTHHLSHYLDFKVANFCAQETVELTPIIFDPCLRLIFTLQGQTHLNIRGKTYNLQAGTPRSAAILPILENEQGNKKFYIREHQHEIVIFIKQSFFSRDWFDFSGDNYQGNNPIINKLFSNHLTIRHIEITPMIRQLLSCLTTYVTGSEIIHRLHNESLVLAILAEVIQQFDNNSLPSKTGDLIQRIEHLVALLDSGQLFDYSIKQMATLCHTNPTTLQYTFKRRYGTTVAAYRRKKQLQQAEWALLHGASVQKAAEIAYYRDLKSFVSAFSQQYGKLPSEFKAHTVR